VTEPAHLRATRVAYDTVAVDYAALLDDELARKPFDRALLDTFAELVRGNHRGPVADLGCGPGRVSAYLQARGLTTFGVDVSSAMIAVARRTYPGIRFSEGSMTKLGLTDGALGGIVAWYSIIHTPPAQLPAVFREFHRVLVEEGDLLLAFQVGDECVHLDHAYGHALSLDAYRLSTDLVAEQLRAAGLIVHTRMLREPEGQEKTPQGYLFARKRRESL